MEKALDLLRRVFGYHEFRHYQEAAIATALEGGDALIVMPTGGGKSLCYQIPALLRDGVGIIVSPLIALMQDQVDALHLLGIEAAFLNSTQDAQTQRDVWRRLEDGSLQLLYVAPERLKQAATLARLTTLPVALIAIDEAHCVSQWGHDFRRDYLALGELGARFPGVPRLALTATATPRTRAHIVENLALSNAREFVAGFDRPNIRYTVSIKHDARRQLGTFLSRYNAAAGIVYCLSRKKVESIAEWLCSQGHVALPYHAGLDAAVRAKHQKRFLREDGVIIVATIAFGMGIDKPDVRFVAHLDLPKSVESYYQETGRAGRDGDSSEAFMVYGLQDVVRLRQMVDESTADENFKRSERTKLDALLGWCEATTCRRRALLEYFGDQQTPDNCGNCDVCLVPPEVYDGTEAAQMLLSAVYRTGQRFGAAHVIDVLLGKITDKVTQHRHADLRVFGIGAQIDANHWRSVIRQLIAHGRLTADAARYGALTLTDASRPLLRGEVRFPLRKEVRTRTATRKVARVEHDHLDAADRDLFEVLRECRQRLASENGVPAYVIFHDATLLQMAQARPASAVELLALNGVGQAKLDRYGEIFMEVIDEFANAPSSAGRDEPQENSVR